MRSEKSCLFLQAIPILLDCHELKYPSQLWKGQSSPATVGPGQTSVEKPAQADRQLQRGEAGGAGQVWREQQFPDDGRSCEGGGEQVYFPN